MHCLTYVGMRQPLDGPLPIASIYQGFNLSGHEGMGMLPRGLISPTGPDMIVRGHTGIPIFRAFL
jgi:hypothetical protein